MANTMIMNITTKKQEYGVLQAVGMTNKQLNLCLQLQGLIFTVGTICVALIIGLPLGYALFSYAKHNGIFGMNIYHVPNRTNFYYDFFGRSVADCTFLRFKQ